MKFTPLIAHISRKIIFYRQKKTFLHLKILFLIKLNLEHLSNFITNNYQLIQQNKLIKNRLKIYIKNYFFILNLKLKKLKLGLVNFEIKQFFFANIFLYDTLEMRYIRQDTTEEDEMSLEHRLEAIK